DRRISIRRNPPPVGRELNDRERLAVLDALALASESLDPRITLRIVGAGGTRLLIGVRGPEPLKHLKPDVTRLTTLSAQIGAAGYFVFTLTPAAAGQLPEARLLCRAPPRIPPPIRACAARRSASPRIRSAATPTGCSGPPWRSCGCSRVAASE